MADEQIPPDKESTLPDDQAEYDALVRKYGEAMLRIGQLESQVNSLTSRLDDRSTPGPPASLGPRRGCPASTTGS